ncbi:MAG: hypothetical protein GX078_03090 [Clostridiales bacterium]|nr:hypothetical protein [Clostridiales bacterium]
MVQFWSLDENSGKTISNQVLITTETNRHFLFGESRWYLYNDEKTREGYTDLQKVYLLIDSTVIDFTKETGFAKDYSDVDFQYIRSPDITDEEIDDNIEWIENYKNSLYN